KAGSVIKKGDKLTFKVSLGKEEVPPQTVNVQVTIPYEEKNSEGENPEQKVEIYVEDADNTMSVPIKELTITETVTESFDVLVKEG
ncbi:serine/threonine protein kinase, partial [bacterium LRH843]|nr:serine/threonine protein kinase [bacterium LRH843]